MSQSRIREIKQAQKERLLFREVSNLFLQLTIDNSKLRPLTISRVQLSPDKSLCTVFFYTPDGESVFQELLETLKLYKPSIRKSIAKNIKARYTPDLRFAFDNQYEKQERIEELFDTIKTDDS